MYIGASVNSELQGTFMCPICYEDTPHEHSGEEVHEYQSKMIKNYQKQIAMREKIDSQIIKGLEKELEAAVKALAAYEKGCDFCRIFNDALIRKHVGTVYMYNDYGLVKKGSELYCPKCTTCVWSSEWSD